MDINQAVDSLLESAPIEETVDPWEEAANLMKRPASAVITNTLKNDVKVIDGALAKAERKMAGLHQAGAGDTESIKILLRVVKPTLVALQWRVDGYLKRISELAQDAGQARRRSGPLS